MVTEITKETYNQKVDSVILYGESSAGDGTLVRIKVNPVTGGIVSDTELTATIDPTGLATSAKQDSILAKLSADPATQTTLAAVLAKIIAAPATEAKQDSTNASLSSIDVKLSEKAQLHANIDFSSASAQTIIAAPGAGSRIRICQLLLMSGAASTVNSEVAIKSGSTTIKTVKGASIALDFPEHCNLGTAEALVLQATTADRIIGGIDYYVEAV